MNGTYEDVAVGLALKMAALLDKICAYRLLEYHSERSASEYVISEILDQCFGKGFTEDRTQFFRFKPHLAGTDFKAVLKNFEERKLIRFEVEREKLTLVICLDKLALMEFVK